MLYHLFELCKFSVRFILHPLALMKCLLSALKQVIFFSKRLYKILTAGFKTAG